MKKNKLHKVKGQIKVLRHLKQNLTPFFKIMSVVHVSVSCD